MNTFRYIGSKARVLPGITRLIGEPRSGRLVDAFCGTGVVSRAAAEKGWHVLANDHLCCATILTRAQLTAETDVEFRDWGGYSEAIRELNSVTPIEGFIYRTYTPASAEYDDHARMYFTRQNGGLIDAIRKKISVWCETGRLDDQEHCVLVADLLVAADKVANTAGTYGAFLRSWSSGAKSRIRLQQRSLLRESVRHEVRCSDVFDLETRRDDVVYLDPPYTKRQYAAYYHLLETIACNDQPEVEGVTGLRPWEDKASQFCYKDKALAALVELISGLTADRILLSYNNDGHISLEDMLRSISKYGGVSVSHLGQIGQYSTNGSNVEVGEFLLQLDKTALPGTGLRDAADSIRSVLAEYDAGDEQLRFQLERNDTRS